MFESHLKTNSKKPLVIAITAVLTTSVLLACTPSRQQEQRYNEARSLPVDKTRLTEKDNDHQVSVGRLPQAVIEEEFREKKSEMERAAAPAKIQAVSQGGAMLLADQTYSPITRVANTIKLITIKCPGFIFAARYFE